MNEINSDPNKLFELAGMDQSGTKMLVKNKWDDELDQALSNIS